jgi:hypothetical protein
MIHEPSSLKLKIQEKRFINMIDRKAKNKADIYNYSRISYIKTIPKKQICSHVKKESSIFHKKYLIQLTKKAISRYPQISDIISINRLKTRWRSQRIKGNYYRKLLKNQVENLIPFFLEYFETGRKSCINYHFQWKNHIDFDYRLEKKS